MKASEKFPTVQELIDDNKFLAFLSKQIADLEQNRIDILSKNDPYSRIKRSAFDFLRDNNLLDPDSLKKQFILVNNKTSQLPSSVRDYIDQVCIIAIRNTIDYYDEIDKKKQELKTNKIGDKKHRNAKISELNPSIEP